MINEITRITLEPISCIRYLDKDQRVREESLNGCGILRIQIWARLKWGVIARACIFLSIFFFEYFISQFKVTWQLIWFLIPILYLTTAVSIFLSISISSMRNQTERATDCGLGAAWFISWIYALFLLVKSVY
jgi:K+-sensing histidine kinase KdpD